MSSKHGVITLTEREHYWLTRTLLELDKQINGPGCKGRDDELHSIFKKLDASTFPEPEESLPSNSKAE